MLVPENLGRARSGLELITGFYQAGAGNCASIAAIKCAIAVRGVAPIYKHAKVSGDSVSVEQLDGTIVVVTATEVELAKRRSGFAGEDVELLRQAHFLFALMAKRAQTENNDGREGMSFAEAIDSLNDGEHWLEGPHWIGMDAWVEAGPNRRIGGNDRASAFLKARRYGIGKSARHVWFASEGQHDEHGVPSPPRWSISGAISLQEPVLSPTDS